MSSEELQPGAHRARRNDACPCGSGKKYKHCCGAHQSDAKSDAMVAGGPATQTVSASMAPIDGALASLHAVTASPRDTHSRALLEQVARHAKSLAAAFQQGASEGSIEQLRSLRRGLVDLLLALPPDVLQHLWSNAIEDAVATILASGLRDLPRTTHEEALLRTCRATQSAGPACSPR
jgi:SEC-C motif